MLGGGKVYLLRRLRRGACCQHYAVRRGDPGYTLKFDRYGEKSVMNKLSPKYLIAAGSCLAAVFMFLAGQEGVGRLLLLSIIPLLYFF